MQDSFIKASHGTIECRLDLKHLELYWISPGWVSILGILFFLYLFSEFDELLSELLDAPSVCLLTSLERVKILRQSCLQLLHHIRQHFIMVCLFLVYCNLPVKYTNVRLDPAQKFAQGFWVFDNTLRDVKVSLAFFRHRFKHVRFTPDLSIALDEVSRSLERPLSVLLHSIVSHIHFATKTDVVIGL